MVVCQNNSRRIGQKRSLHNFPDSLFPSVPSGMGMLLQKNSDTVCGVITYLQYRCFPVDSIYNNRSHNYHSLCETKQNIFLYTTMLYRVFDLLRFSGVDGSRTRVQKPIPCPSTSVVYSLTFPPRPGNKHPEHFSSFMLRPYAQSFAYVVSHMFEAGILRCECPRADCCH